MAFPTIAGTVATNGTAAATNKVCNIGSPSAQQLVILCLRSNGADTHSTPAGWTALVLNNASDASNDVTSIFYKVAAGTEGATVTVNGTASLKFSAVAIRINAFTHDPTTAPSITAVGTGSSTTPDPPSLTPAGGAKDFLWIAVAAYEGEQTNPPTYPGSYTLGQVSADSGTAGVVTTNSRNNFACRQNNIATEDPGTYTISVSDDWSAWTIAVFPALATRGRVSWAEFQVPLQPTRGRVSWAEFQTPLAPTRGRVSWTEFQTPLAPTRGRISWTEFQVPLAPTRGRVSWAEFQVPDAGALSPTRGRVSWTEFQVPTLATRGRISWAELAVPPVNGIACDAFNRADGPLGANWSDGVAAETISGQRIGANNAGTHSFMFWNANPFPNDQASTLTLTDFGGTTVKGIGVCVRASANNGYSFKALTNLNRYQLVRTLAGVVVEIGSNAQVPAANDALELDAVSTTLTGKVNDSPLITTTDANLSSGAAGVAGYDVFSGGAGNLLGDNWCGASLGYGAAIWWGYVNIFP